MLTVIIKRTDEPNVIQFTQELVMQELAGLHGSEMLLEDSWLAGLRKVRTPFVCLVEPDCILSFGGLAANVGSFGRNVRGEKGRGKGGGGYTKLAMMASCLCVNNLGNRLYGYHVSSGELRPERQAGSTEPYHVQVASVLGAVIRYSSIKDTLETIDWDDANPVRLSVSLSLYLWDTGRRIKVNPLTEYITADGALDTVEAQSVVVTPQVQTLFDRNYDILNNPKVRP